MMTLVTCMTAACDECGDHPDMDDVNPHFATAHDAIAWLREAGWRVFKADFMVCPDCSVRHDCEVYGHVWTDWRDCRCDGRLYSHVGTSGAPCGWTYRVCERCSIGEDHLPGSATDDDPASDHPEPAATPGQESPPVRVSQHPASEPKEITSMSDTSPEGQTSDRHATRKIVTAVLGLTLAALLAGCNPANGGTTVPNPTAIDAPAEEGARVEFSAECDDTGFAYNIEPDTPEAIDAAQESCRRMDDAIDNAPWPGGMRPQGDVAVDR